MPRNSQSPPSAVDRTSSLSAGCAPTSAGTGSGPATTWLRSRPRPSTSTSPTSPGWTGRGTRQQHVPRVQRDGAGYVGDEVVHVPLHLVGGAVLRQVAVDVGAQPLAAEVPAGDQPGP